MVELTDKSANYAAGRVNQVLTDAIAQAYIDGYRDGYKDCKEEIPIDFRDNRIGYVDLGLPSGTLWAGDYEKEEDNVTYLPYCKAALLNIPTMEQWEELFESCRWECVTPNGLQTDSIINEVLCVGPNGNVLKFERTGIREVTENICNYGEIYFWLMDNEEGREKNSVILRRCLAKRLNNVSFYNSYYETTKLFSGYRLPVRLVRTK